MMLGGALWWSVDDEEPQMGTVAGVRAYVTGQANQRLLLRNEYLAAENGILGAHLPARLRLSDPARSALAEIAK